MRRSPRRIFGRCLLINMKRCVLLQWLLLLASLATAKVIYKNEENIVPSPFPVNFRMSFRTNITAEDDHYPVRGMLYYDWPTKRQRVDHGAGSYECIHFYNTSQACTMYFSPKGLHRIIHGPITDNEQRCCLDLPNITTPQPDWASNVNSTFNGVVHDEYSEQETYQWTFDKLEPQSTGKKNHRQLTHVLQDYHIVREVARGKNAGKPVLFSFPGTANGRQDFHYDVNSLVVGPQDKKLFELPDCCSGAVCTNTTSHVVREDK